jgi:hypothetical protein
MPPVYGGSRMNGAALNAARRREPFALDRRHAGEETAT